MIILFRLNKDQKGQILKDIKGATDAIKLKHGLEKALNTFVKDPNQGVPEEMK